MGFNMSAKYRWSNVVVGDIDEKGYSARLIDASHEVKSALSEGDSRARHRALKDLDSLAYDAFQHIKPILANGGDLPSNVPLGFGEGRVVIGTSARHQYYVHGKTALLSLKVRADSNKS